MSDAIGRITVATVLDSGGVGFSAPVCLNPPAPSHLTLVYRQ
jgi:hypothetical protein